MKIERSSMIVISVTIFLTKITPLYNVLKHHWELLNKNKKNDIYNVGNIKKEFIFICVNPPTTYYHQQSLYGICFFLAN
jgi:hypothetical protein